GLGDVSHAIRDAGDVPAGAEGGAMTGDGSDAGASGFVPDRRHFLPSDAWGDHRRPPWGRTGPAPRPRRPLLRARLVDLVLALILTLMGGAAGWFWRRERLPAAGDPTYERYVEAFEIGTAALDAGVNDLAEQELTRAIGLVPGEPAAWANRGLAYVRSHKLEKARADLAQAARLAPDNADVEEMLGILAEENGNLDEAIDHTPKALKLKPGDF